MTFLLFPWVFYISMLWCLARFLPSSTSNHPARRAGQNAWAQASTRAALQLIITALNPVRLWLCLCCKWWPGGWLAGQQISGWFQVLEWNGTLAPIHSQSGPPPPLTQEVFTLKQAYDFSILAWVIPWSRGQQTMVSRPNLSCYLFLKDKLVLENIF